MEHQLTHYFLTLPEPTQSALLCIRNFLTQEMALQEHWKYNTPFYYFNGKWFCYMSYHQKRDQCYLGFVKGYKIQHPQLISGGRKQIKIYPINPKRDINIQELKEIVTLQQSVY